MLRVERLQVAGLPPLSFEVADGECLAIEGASGAGKTLLLRAIADLDPAAGDVVVDGEERREMPALRVAAARALLRRRTGVVDRHAARLPADAASSAP